MKKKTGFFNINKWKCVSICMFHYWFALKFVFIWSIPLMYKYLPELIKRRSKVQEKNVSCEHTLNFDQWKTFSENYKQIRVRLWLVYKFTMNNCHLRLFSEFIQTEKRHPTSLDKIRILTSKLLVRSRQNFPCELNSQRTYSLQNISNLSLPL